MKLRNLLISVLLAGPLASLAPAQVVINEVLGITTSSDTEFIELYNTGATAIDLTDWTVEVFESDDGSSFGDQDKIFTITEGSIPAGGYFLLGDPNFIAGFGITPDAQIPSNFIENSSYTLIVRDASATRVASVFVTDGDAGDAANDGGTPITPDLSVGPDGNFLPAGFARTPDGGTSFTILEFSPIPAPTATPGAANPFLGGPLAVALGASSLDEGGSATLTGTVSVQQPVSGDLEVAIALTPGDEATVTTEGITIPDGQTTGTFTIEAIDDFWSDGDQTVTVTVSATLYTEASTTFTVTDDEAPGSYLLAINEVYYGADDSMADANGDGTADTARRNADEFIELVNVSDAPLDLTGVTLFDNFGGDGIHTFPEGTVLESGCAVLIFGGGDLLPGSTAAFGTTPVRFSSNGGLFLDDDGSDFIRVIDSDGGLTGTPGAEVFALDLPDQTGAPTAGSYALQTDLDPTSGYSFHTTIPATGGAAFSPGVQLDGTTPFCLLTEALDVSFNVADIDEAAVSVTAAGTVTLPSPAPNDVLFFIEISDPSRLQGPTFFGPLTIPSGATSADFDLFPVDTIFQDGDATITVTARAWGYLNASADIQVIDDETAPFTPPNVVINEIDAQTPGTDIAEFIELYNNSSTPQSLDGVLLVLINGNGDDSYNIINLAENIVPGNGFFVIGNDGVPNVDLVFGPTGNGVIQNGVDAAVLVAGNPADFANGVVASSIPGLILDAVIHDDGGRTDADLIAALAPGEMTVTENGNGDAENESAARFPDGGAAFDSSVFVSLPPTPGAPNVAASSGGFADWAAANGIAGEAPDADTDGDGLSNLLEYAIDGLDPTAGDVLSGFDGSVLSFTKRPEAVTNGDVTYRIESSTDLGIADPWTEVSGPDYINDATTISFELPAGETRIFARLSVVGP